MYVRLQLISEARAVYLNCVSNYYVSYFTIRTIKKCIPLVHGFSQSVMKSTTICSISKTVVVFPWITVMLEALLMVSCARPPENMIYVSLKIIIVII